MNFRIWAPFVALALFCCASGRSRDFVDLPQYAPPLRVFAGDGKRLDVDNPTAELASKVKIRLLTDVSFSPSSEEAAACELKIMLPSEFRAFLVENRDELRAKGIVAGRREESWRLYDLAQFLERSWGQEWSGERDRIARTIHLLFLFDSCVANNDPGR